MSTPIVKNFWLTLLVLLCVHTAVCFAADRLFTSRYTAPPDATSVETTTPEQRARGEASFTMVKGRTERPVSVIFYAFAGYVGLLAAAAWALFTRMQNH
jgi:hypothetical protein